MKTSFSKKEIFKILIKEFHTEPIPETIERDLYVPLNSKKIVTIYGPRRSGKSFYFFNLIKKFIKDGTPKEQILYLNFEDDRILPLDFKELDLLVEAYYELYPENKQKTTYFFFDEIQNIKNWEIFVRRIYDKERIKLFITGSSSKLLSREIATSLRGRTLSFGLYPLTFKEFLRFKGEELQKNYQYTSQRFKLKKLLDEYIEWGGFPEVVLEKEPKLKKKILIEYYNLLVYRDLVERYSISNPILLKEIIKFLATNICSYFSINAYYKTIKDSIPVSRETIAQYINFILESEYFFFLPQFSYSLKVQQANPKKILSLDNGLRNTISFRFSRDEGKLVENLVGSVLKTYYNGELYYWKDKREVDFVTSLNYAFNVCFGEKIDERQIKSLLEFKKKNKGIKNLIIISKETEGEKNGIKYIPLWKWLIEL